MIPPSVQKMIEEEAYKFYKNYIYGPPSFNYNPHKCFKSGASFSYELGFSQGMKEIESLQAKLKVACDALEYYSDEENHNNDFQFDLSDVPYITNEGEHDCYLVGGKRAREALAEIRKKDE